MAAVGCSHWIFMMASVGMGREPVPRVYGLVSREASTQRGIFRKDAPSNHDAGSGAHAHRKETMMRFYKQPPDEQRHRFYCGVDLHARCMYLHILDQPGQALLH